MPSKFESVAIDRNYGFETNPHIEITAADRRRALRYATMVLIHLERKNDEAAHAVIDEFVRSLARDEPPEIAPDTALALLDLDVRTINALEEEGMYTVGHLARWRAEGGGYHIPNLGPKALEHLDAVLAELY